MVEWPDSHINYSQDEIKNELKKSANPLFSLNNEEIVTHTTFVNTEKNIEPFYVPKVSKFSESVGAFAWINRFIYNCKKENTVKRKGFLTFSERIKAEKLFC